MLTGDAQWKVIQKNTFTRWTNERLKTVTKHVTDLETDLSDGLQLIALVEVLSGKRFPKFNNNPNIRTMKLENVTMALKFLQDEEGIKLVNIDSSDIVDHNLKLILGLIWTLILHYSISMPLWEDDEGRPQKQEQTPKQRLFGWIQNKLPNRPVGNLTTDWNDGIAIGALVDGVAPGLCPDWESWNPENNVENATEAMDAAEQWLDIPQLIQPAEMCNPDVDELSMMTYLSQFPSAKLKSAAPLRPKTNPAQVRALGPEVEHLERKIRATKMNFQETNIRIEHSEHFQETTIITETELKEAKRENEILKEENKILKQEMEQKTKLKCCASEVEQLEKELRATKMNFQEINIRIEHLEHFQKTTIITETELKEAKRENEILKEEIKILKQEMEHKTKLGCFASEVEQLKKELSETKMKLQETNRRTEHLNGLQKTMETELIVAKREIENLKEEKIMKQELVHKTKLECLASVGYECTDEVGVRDHEKCVPGDPTKTFDDSSMFRAGNYLFIVGMKLHTRMWGPHKVIGAMEVFYNTGQSVVHGSKNPNTAVKDEEFRIGQNEYITEINVQMGHMLDGLKFTTNKGIVHGPFGGAGGTHRRFVCPREGAYLAYITGSVDAECNATAIRRLRFVWGVPKYVAAK